MAFTSPHKANLPAALPFLHRGVEEINVCYYAEQDLYNVLIYKAHKLNRKMH
jgi:hypothetical protein